VPMRLLTPGKIHPCPPPAARSRAHATRPLHRATNPRPEVTTGRCGIGYTGLVEFIVNAMTDMKEPYINLEEMV